MTTPTPVNDPTPNLTGSTVPSDNGFKLPAGWAEKYTVVSYEQLGKSYSDRLSTYVGQIIGVYAVLPPEKTGKKRKIKNTEDYVDSEIYKLGIAHGDGLTAEVKVPEAVSRNMSKRMKAQVAAGNSNPIIMVRVMEETDAKGNKSVYLQDAKNPRPRVKRPRSTRAKIVQPAQNNPDGTPITPPPPSTANASVDTTSPPPLSTANASADTTPPTPPSGGTANRPTRTRATAGTGR